MKFLQKKRLPNLICSQYFKDFDYKQVLGEVNISLPEAENLSRLVESSS